MLRLSTVAHPHRGAPLLRRLVALTHRRAGWERGRRLGWALLAGLLLLMPGSARADDWVRYTPKAEDAEGVKVGQRSRFHPGLAATVGWDSNVYWNDANEVKRSAFFVTPSAWLGVGNRKIVNGQLDSPAQATGSIVDYNIGVLGGYRFYMTRNPEIFQAGKLNLGARARIVFGPGRRFSFAINEDFYRIGEPRTFEATREFNFNRFDHRGSLVATLRPGGGRFSLSGRYINQVLYFQASDLPTGDRIVNGGGATIKWRVRDRSAILVDYQFLKSYYLCCADVGEGRNEDSRQHKVFGGYAGHIGQRWSFELMAGYGKARYYNDNNGPDFSGVLFKGNMAYFPTERTMIRADFGRDMRDSLFGNFITDLGGGLYASHLFRWKMLLSGGMAVYARRYAGLPTPDERPDIVSFGNAPGFVRTDTILAGDVRIEQALGRIFAVAAQYNVAADITSFSTTYDTGDIDLGGYVKHVVMIFGAIRF